MQHRRNAMMALLAIASRLNALKLVSANSIYGQLAALTASLAVIAGSVLSVRSLGIQTSDINPGPLLILAIASVLLVPLNAAEFRVTGRLCGTPVSRSYALRTTVIASALNVLPLPAGAIVRIQGLRHAGNSGRRATTATFTVAILWLAMSGTLASIALILRGDRGPAISFAIASTGLLTVGILLLKSLRAPLAMLATIFAVEFAFVALAAIRFLMVLRGIGLDVDTGQAVVVASSSSLASTIGILPGAFGIFEGIAAALSVVVSLPASAGFLATALLRLISGIIVGIAAITITLRRRKHESTDDQLAEVGSAT